jgi:acyl-[acyl-carrier-protein]-phospholipid O-acyltransferase/long-chain-fatty-acid--[acyl-carrier-protein] ligase
MKAIAPIGWFLMIGTGSELLLAYMIPQRQPLDEVLRFDWNKYRRGVYLRNNLTTVLQREVIILSIIGLSIFWAIGQVLLASFPAFAKEQLGLTNAAVLQGILACAGIGIMAGSLIAGRVSRGHIETGLIPVGSFGIALCLLLLPGLETTYAHVLNFLLIGMFGGIFIIPLNALIQFHATEHELGRILAGNNFIQNITMLSFLMLTVVLATVGLGSVVIFYILLVVAVAGAIYTLYKLPQSMVRLLAGMVIGQRYSLEVIGMNNIPEQGGVLMLGNHISWIDWAIIQMACPRPIRFVMHKELYQRWYLRWFLDFFGVVPISSAASKGAIETIAGLINEGQVVCLFPEGTISRSGQISEFHRGYEKAAAVARGIILPFYLRGLWGTWFSRASDKLKVIRRDGVKRDIIVAFGPPLPMQTRAEQLKQRIFDLSIDSWQRYTDTLDPLAVSWLKTVKRVGNNAAIVDSIGEPMLFYRLAAAVIGFSRLIRRNSRDRNIGILLPVSSAGAITNMAAMFCGKTAVNLNYSAAIESLMAAADKAELRTIYTSRIFLQRLEQRDINLASLLDKTTVYYLEDLKQRISRPGFIITLLLLRMLPTALLKLLFCKRVHLDDPAAILFSSGSEGVPKGVMLSHRNIMANLKQISDVLNIQDSDVMMCTMPLFHAIGLTAMTFMPMIEGVPMVCHPDPTDGLNIGKAVARFKATILVGTSTFLRLYTKNPKLHPLMFESLRLVVAGAEKLSADVRESFKLKFNKDILEAYGCTETTPVATANLPDYMDTNFWKVQSGSRTGSVGLPLPGTSLRIVDPVTLQELPTGTDGLIMISGAQVMLGYLNDREKTDEVIVKIDGRRWYKTGDKGHVDEDGFLTVVDRYSRFAKLAGEMVSLTAVEEQVRITLKDPELDLAAISLPDDKKGEKITLVVENKVDKEEIRKALLTAGMNPLMIPAEIINLEQIPKLGSGKNDFTTLRRMLSDTTI